MAQNYITVVYHGGQKAAAEGDYKQYQDFNYTKKTMADIINSSLNKGYDVKVTRVKHTTKELIRTIITLDTNNFKGKAAVI